MPRPAPATPTVKNSTIVFPAPLMSTIGELGAFLGRENAAAGDLPGEPTSPPPSNGDRAATTT